MKVITLDTENFEEVFQLRKQMLIELDNTRKLSSDFENATKQYFLNHINKDLFCFGVQKDGKVVSTAYLCMFSRLPSPENLSGQEGYILNVYTLPQYRKNGCAKVLLEEIICFCETNKIERVWLNASEQGAPVYTACGFTPKSGEMERKIACFK